MTLSSLSSTDYPCLLELCDDLLDYCAPRDIGLSLPSLRADTFSMNLMERLQRVRKGGRTFAPEAGTQRLRDAINKNLREEDLLQSVRTCFSGGWNGVKLYFMLGLPTETDEDVLGTPTCARKVYFAWKECSPNKARGVRITVSTSWFVPKPHTAFQWEAQITREEYQRRVDLLRDALKRDKSITYNWHDPETSYLEAVFSRGDRRLADVLEYAWQHGAKMDSWSEYFGFQRWMDALRPVGWTGTSYAHRERPHEAGVPLVPHRPHTSPRLPVAGAGAVPFLLPDHPGLPHPLPGCGANRLLKGGCAMADPPAVFPRPAGPYISITDLMRTFQRAFARAGIPLKHTEGFHPHPLCHRPAPSRWGTHATVRNPGVRTAGEGTPYEAVPARLTAAMPEGIVIHQCYPAQRKLKELTYLNYIMNFEYSEGRPQETELAIWSSSPTQPGHQKKKRATSQKGYQGGGPWIPLIRSFNLECQSDTLTLDAVVQAQNPGLNPELIRAAFCQAYPDLTPDFVTFHRREVLDGRGRCSADFFPLSFWAAVRPPSSFISFGGDDGALPLKSLPLRVSDPCQGRCRSDTEG